MIIITIIITYVDRVVLCLEEKVILLYPWPAQQQDNGVDGDDGNSEKQPGNEH